MAPAPEARKRGFSFTSPGAKEYLIVGGVTLGVVVIYFWWKNRTTTTTPATTDSTGSTAPSTPTGLSTSQFLAWIQDHTSSTTTTTSPVKKTKTGTVPDVVGKPGEEARDAISDAGFRALQTPPTTAKGKRTIVTSQNPAGGRRLPEGSTVAIAVKVDEGARL
jgi:cytoskeletal protein RodZ